MITKKTLLLTTIIMTSFLTGWTQTEPLKEVVTLKTIVSLQGKPVVYQNQIKGGIHQIDDAPESISADLVEKLMVATNTADNTTFRYLGETGTNVASDWESVFLVTDFDEDKFYAAGEIVIATRGDGQTQMFRAKADLSSSDENPFVDFDSWTPLGATTTFIDQNNSSKIQLVSGSQTIVLASSDYVLPSASSVVGQTYVIKNKNTTLNTIRTASESSTDQNTGEVKSYTVSTATAYQLTVRAATGETIDENNYEYYLYKKNDFLSFISDGENWHYINKGGSQDLYLYPYPPARENNNIDAQYYGKRDENGNYVTGSYRTVCYQDAGTYRFSVQRYTEMVGWQQTGSH